ncbi:SDR family NAD(P)-dependent oxidoreductase [Actinokineospora terrae]|uniref:Short chain dehydrogenase n=1 Tax=Actinokineospora terrae TaxID=155974 RepID=A0A1H9MG80_9PSEU|nr:SDR family NAD(P)-dependent oxidoreductase [Actinokineospora terrae]SER22664.1 short chain dehydrogenase [Actinokineospora terrae]
MLHALVNNAGIQVNGPVEALPMARWRRVFEVDLFGHIAVTQALLPALLRGGGRVVNISSTGGTVAISGVTADAAAKVIANAVTTRRPRTRYTIGRDAALITRLARVLPDRALDRITATNLRRHYPKAYAG